MKELAHYAFSVGASVYALSVLGFFSLPAVVASVWLSLSVNYVIDILGHSHQPYPSRTRLTHSVFTAPVWGALVSLASVVAFTQVTAGSTQPMVVIPWVFAGVLIAIGHLFLDSFTQAGVYYWKHRVAIAHFRYDNPLLNASFVLVGLTLLALSVVPVVSLERAIGLSLQSGPGGPT